MIVKIKDKDYEFSIGFGVLAEFEKKTNKKFTEIDDSAIDILNIIHCALTVKNRNDFNMTVDELADAIDDNIDVVVDAINQIQLFGEQLKEKTSAISKKK